MQSGKRKFETEISDSTSDLTKEPKKKLSRRVRYNRKKRRLREEASQDESEVDTPEILEIPEITNDVISDQNQHQIQQSTQELCTEDRMNDLEEKQIIIPEPIQELCTEDKINDLEEKQIIIPEPTQELCTENKMNDLGEKQIIIPEPSVEINSQRDISARSALIEFLVKKARLASNDYDITSIPTDFLIIVDYRIIAKKSIEVGPDDRWIAFGKWIGLREPVKKRDVRNHLRSRWNRLRHAEDMQAKAKNTIPGCAVN